MKTRAREREASEAQDLLDLVGWADDHRADTLATYAGAAVLPGHDQHTMPIMMSSVPVDEFCLAEFEPFVGMSFEDSELDINYFTPTEDSWTRLGDREILCFILSATAVTGTLEGTAR